MANVDNRDGTFQIDLMGGCNFIVDPQKPHLGGNMGGGDSATAFKDDLFQWLVKKYSITSLIDVGCAEGHALRDFLSLGVTKVLGIEGLAQNAAKCGVPVVVHDLTDGPYIVDGYDFVWCSDVAEHIEEKYAMNLLKTLANGNILAMAQGDETMDHSGWHHVNNKPESYWIEKLKEVGFYTDEEATQESRKQTTRGIWPTLGRIYVKRQV